MIVYPGVLERMAEQRRLLEGIVDEQISALDPGKRTEVSDACSSCGLDAVGTREVLAITCDLINFERDGRNRVLTDAQRFEIIEYIRDTSYLLAEALRELPLLSEGLKLRKVFRDVSNELGELERMKLDDSKVPDSLTLAVLGEAANRLLNTIRDLEGKGGRRNLRKHYNYFVSDLALTFDRCGLTIGRGGPFERLCSVVFEVAGVRATPEGAIRYYLEHRNKHDDKLPENSGK